MAWGIVTASSRGIGFTVAKALARAGYNLVIGSRSEEKIRAAARRLEEEYRVRVVGLRLDLRSRESLEAFLSQADNVVGDGLEVFVVNYGNPSCEPCTIFEASWEDWLEAASMYLASTARILSWLRAHKPVRTIIISSFTVREPHPPLGVADTVRQGLSALVRLAAREEPELGPVLLMLGSFRTPGALETIGRLAGEAGVSVEEYWRRYVDSLSPLGRSGRLEELEEMILLLARAPAYLTGATILFDGASSRCI